jgi:hypothetical protein
MKTRRLLQLSFRVLIAIPLVASTWAPGQAHAIPAAADSTPTVPHTSGGAPDDLPCHGSDGSHAATPDDTVPDAPQPVSETAPDDDGSCQDSCCPVAICAPASCVSHLPTGNTTAALGTCDVTGHDSLAALRSPRVPRPPPGEQLRPPIR